MKYKPYRIVSTILYLICRCYGIPLEMIQGECEKCDDLGETHGVHCIVRKLIFERDFQNRSKRYVSRKEAMDAAVLALQKILERDKKRAMSASIIPFESIKTKGRKKMSVSLPVNQEQQQTKAMVQPSSQQPYFPSESDWKLMLNWGATALKSGMLPSVIKSAEAAAIIALKGRELGLPFMVAIAHIHVINGKPSMSAEMQQTLARKNLPGLVINILESDSKVAKIEFIRPEKGSRAFVSTFTIDDAKQANLLGKDVWRQYPAAMLFSRAISAGLRKICPEALMGVSYTPEELGANVDQEGNVIETTGRSVTEGTSEPGKTILPKPKNESTFTASQLSAAQIGRMFAIAKGRGIHSKDELKDWIANTFDFSEPFSLTDLTRQEYDDICNELQKKIEPSQPVEFSVPEETMLEPGSDEMEEPAPVVAPAAASSAPEAPWAKYRDAKIVK